MIKTNIKQKTAAQSTVFEQLLLTELKLPQKERKPV